VPTIFCLSQCVYVVDVDAKVRVYLRGKRILTSRSVDVAFCWLPHKKVDFST